MAENRLYQEIQDEILLEQNKLKNPELSDDEQEAILRRIMDLLEERKGAVIHG